MIKFMIEIKKGKENEKDSNPFVDEAGGVSVGSPASPPVPPAPVFKRLVRIRP